MKYAIYKLSTGEIEGNCPICGIQTCSDIVDYENDPIPADHGKYILVEEEKDKIHEIDNSNLLKTEYKYKISSDGKTLEDGKTQEKIIIADRDAKIDVILEKDKVIEEPPIPKEPIIEKTIAKGKRKV